MTEATANALPARDQRRGAFQVLGCGAGILLSLPAAVLAARGLVAGRMVNAAMRVTLGVVRALPDIAWALIVVVALRLGRLAIMIFTLGKAVRASTIWGLVCAGAIWVALQVGFDLFVDPTAMTVILMTAVVVILVEEIGGFARNRIIGESR